MTVPTFPTGGEAWFEALAKNMNKSWFDSHKAEYKRLWSDPMRAVLGAVAERLAESYGLPLAPPKVHRIHNDRRFHDRPPYKLHCGGYIGLPGGSGTMVSPVALHISFGDEPHVGAGVPTFADSATVARWRSAVVDETTGPELESLLADASRAGLRPLAFSTLKRGPAGLQDHPRVELLKFKGLILTADPPDPTDAALVDKLVILGHAMAPTVRWLARNVTGPAGA